MPKIIWNPQAKAPEPPRDFAVDSATPDVPSDLQGAAVLVGGFNRLGGFLMSEYLKWQCLNENIMIINRFVEIPALKLNKKKTKAIWIV